MEGRGRHENKRKMEGKKRRGEGGKVGRLESKDGRWEDE